MTSAQIRQSFLDFFKSKGHTIVPSSSLMPDSPNLLFTNAGMNQFVPIFLGQRKPDVNTWPGAIPGSPAHAGRAADTQKCIRAGGKHNDLEDVGLDTYHHTFFEMLGNWSFGDYFKREAIEWAWELVTGVWKFPKDRLYATVYKPGPGDPSEFDQEAWNCWAEKFRAAGLDPAIHIVNGNKKDNFWMMGDTGPCGPCSEIHVDLTPDGDTRGALVNKGDARCIEIWNLVFIQFNAQPAASALRADSAPTERTLQPAIEYVPLSARHVDTGMGFERVTSIIQGTKGFTDFKNAKISNYETDIFRPIFDALEKLSGKRYGSTLPVGQASSLSQTSEKKDGDRLEACPTQEQIAIDIAFRVIADHIRTLSFAIADGIQPGNTDRNYVLRRILRRAVRYGRTLGFHEPFFYKLVDVLAQTMGDVFPEIRTRKQQVQETIRIEEEAFNKTLDKGLLIFEHEVMLEALNAAASKDGWTALGRLKQHYRNTQDMFEGKEPEFVTAQALVLENGKGESVAFSFQQLCSGEYKKVIKSTPVVSGEWAFKLYDTYGFPFDLTELMARERGWIVDAAGFNRLMEKQREQSRITRVTQIIELSQVRTTMPTKFVGFDTLAVKAKVLEVVAVKDKTAVVLDTSSAYAEMGGQVGDTAQLYVATDVSPQETSNEMSAALLRAQPRWKITNTQRSGGAWLHFLGGNESPETGSEVIVEVDRHRRRAIERHHTVTHLLHWALHEVVSKEASQKGSFVGPDKLTFDFNAQPLTAQQVADIEKLVNERILENAPVSWTEVKYNHVKDRKDVMQFFGEKYGDWVRVVQIGGQPTALDGYSMELCGGTHTRATGEIGLFRIVGENAIAAGVRRIEAVAGLEAYNRAQQDLQLINNIAGRVNSPVRELEKKIESLLAQQKELEKQVKIAMQRNASNAASELLTHAKTVNGIPSITHNLGDAEADFLQAIVDALKGQFKGVIVLGGGAQDKVTLIANVAPEFTAKIQAGKIIQTIAPIVGGKGGGKPDNARGGGKDASKLDEALAKAKSLIG